MAAVAAAAGASRRPKATGRARIQGERLLLSAFEPLGASTDAPQLLQRQFRAPRQVQSLPDGAARGRGRRPQARGFARLSRAAGALPGRRLGVQHVSGGDMR